MNRRARRHPIVTLGQRLVGVVLAIVVVGLVGVEFGRVVMQNITMSRDIASVQHDIATLRHRQAQQRRDIQRLSTAQGAVPEIHDRLRLVRANETIIFLKPTPVPSTEP